MRAILRSSAPILLAATMLLVANPATSTRASTSPLWVNDLAYGSIGGGFYWDPQSGMVWTGDRSWHRFAPEPPRTVTPLWVNDLQYPSAGRGFWLDPLARQVWTAECGWHFFNRAGCDARASFGNGINVVGRDLIAGVTYRTRTPAEGCYWARLSGFGGTLAEIIANDFTNGYAVVTIGANDAGFESSRCATWTRDLSPVTSSLTAPVTANGTYIVGVDIAPGRWRATDTDGCYWARLRGFSGEFKDIIANEFVSGHTVVDIAPTDVGFETNRCGRWVRELAPVTANPAGPITGSGTFIVGLDIAPGRWRAESTTDCYWARLGGFSGEFKDIIANGFVSGAVVVDILPTDAGFETNRCGTWMRIQ